MRISRNNRLKNQIYKDDQIQYKIIMFGQSVSSVAQSTALQASLSITNSRSSLKLTSIESVMPSSHLILCCPLFLLSPVSRSIRVMFGMFKEMKSLWKRNKRIFKTKLADWKKNWMKLLEMKKCFMQKIMRINGGRSEMQGEMVSKETDKHWSHITIIVISNFWG